jgi:hypothetical protein
MNLPPLPEPEFLGWDQTQVLNGFSAEQMQAYALLAIKQRFGKGKRGPKFSAKDVAYIRELHAQGFAYKEVSRQIEMAEATFFKIVHHRGAYK